MTEAAIIGLRWLQYAGAVALLGGPLFLLTSFRRDEVPGTAWAKPLTLVAALTVAIASALALVAQTAMMAGSWSEAFKPASLAFVVTGTALGLALLVRATVAMVATVLVCLLPPRRALWSLLVLLGLIVSASFAWTGHGASTEGAGRTIHLGLDILHAIAAALWLGALAILTLLLSRPAMLEPRQTHRVLHGFSGLGTLAVALLTVTGLGNSWFLVGPDRFASLPQTLWGQLLIGKLALFVLMCGFAAMNRFRMTPALDRAVDEGAGVASSLDRLRRSVLLETLAGVLLLALVAVMGVQAPPAAM
ncbi:MAG: copper resistance protein CopD [Caulobacteraceae bacterium]|nr:copper resistance protein CopD [Caulobacteraceae bacterium]